MEQNPGENQGEITRLLRAWGDGNQEALEKLMPLVYRELRRQAVLNLRRERSNHTLQPTALIHEAYLKLLNQSGVNWESRNQFFAIAAKSMRRILVDYARMKKRGKRGGDVVMIPIDEALEPNSPARDTDLIALDDSLNRLAEQDERQARIVELRYFSGLSLEETAEVMGLSRTTVASEWSMAKAWLLRELTR